MRFVIVALALALASSPVLAQNLSLRGPVWAQTLLLADLTPTTGGRAALNEAGVDIAARVTIAPYQGGVARVIRYEQRGADASLVLRRFTGHPSSGWWMWGPDTPTITTPAPGEREELARLIRSAMGASAALGATSGPACPAGEQAFIELASGGRAISAARVCVNDSDAAGRVASRLSLLAGSRTEEELHQAAADELLEVDRDFNVTAQREGLRDAFAAFAAEEAITFRNGGPVIGPAEAATSVAALPQGSRLVWAPETARVSERGDMGWTWGRSTYTPPNGRPSQSCYVTIWRRDYEGRWRFAFDGGLRHCGAAD